MKPALLALLIALPALAQDPRRPGSDFMSPALQALQRDPTQHPGQLAVAEGEALWSRAGQGNAHGPACSACHAQVPAVNATYPRAEAGRPLTLALQIDRCRARQGHAPQGPDGPAVLALQALIAQRSAGQAVRFDPALAPWAERGAALWRQRFGQLNLACTQCHDDRAGQRLGGSTIPQAHPTGYPTYRLEWQGLGSLERRMRGCLTGVRAEAFAPGADEWLALEAFLVRRAEGLAWEGVALRP